MASSARIPNWIDSTHSGESVPVAYLTLSAGSKTTLAGSLYRHSARPQKCSTVRRSPRSDCQPPDKRRCQGIAWSHIRRKFPLFDGRPIGICRFPGARCFLVQFLDVRFFLEHPPVDFISAYLLSKICVLVTNRSPLFWQESQATRLHGMARQERRITTRDHPTKTDQGNSRNARRPNLRQALGCLHNDGGHAVQSRRSAGTQDRNERVHRRRMARQVLSRASASARLPELLRDEVRYR